METKKIESAEAAAIKKEVKSKLNTLKEIITETRLGKTINYELKSIAIGPNGHYTCVIKYSNSWYFYNDVGKQFYKCADNFKNLQDPTKVKDYWNTTILTDQFTYTKTGNIIDNQKALDALQAKYGAQEFWKNISGDNYALKNSIAGWGAKNANFLNTGIYLKIGRALKPIHLSIGLPGLKTRRHTIISGMQRK